MLFLIQYLINIIDKIMSLFKLKHLWIESFPEYQLDEHHLSINEIDRKPALALGNFSGRFQVYKIQTKNQFKLNSIYDTNFNTPIVAVEFVNSPENRDSCVGVLLQRKFVYVFLKVNHSGVYDTRHVVINIQPSFAIQPITLSTMTLNSSIQYLNPLSKQQLKVSDPIYQFCRKGDLLYYSDGQQLVLVQNTTQQWRIIVGPIRSIFCLKSKDVVIVIGNNGLWEVQQSAITKTKVIQEDVSCAAIVQLENGYNVLIADFKYRIFVFNSEFRLIWAVKVNQVPIKMLIYQGKELNGAIAMLGEEGSVSISYLGTQVPQTQIQPLNQQINMQEVESQTKRLLLELKASQQKSQQPQTALVSDESTALGVVNLNARCGRPQCYNLPVQNGQKYFNQNGQPWSCQLTCQLNSKQSISDIVISVEGPTNISFLENSKKIGGMKAGGSQNAKFVMFCSSQKFPYGDCIDIIVRYQHDKNQSLGILQKKCQIPFTFQCTLKTLQLEQKPTNKIIFKSQKDLPSLCEIFDQLKKQIESSKNITIRLANGILCSIGYNKNNTKLKIQSNYFSALCYIFVVFLHRFEKIVKNGKIQNQIVIDDIPLEEFFTLMKDHYNVRLQLKQRYNELQIKCEQFRNTQKKLLIKMKQKASSINNLDKLLQYTYKNLIKSADAFQHTRQQLQTINHNLQISLIFILQLLFLKTKATEKCRQKVLGIIGYEKECMDYGWEQKILSNSAYYLNKKFNYNVDKFTFDQLYKTVLWVVSKVNSGDWNQ